MARIGVPREIAPRETRVALVPESVRRLASHHQLLVEAGAGLLAGASDADYAAAGAQAGLSCEALFAGAEVILKVRAPLPAEVARLQPGQVLIALLFAHDEALLEALADRGVDVLALGAIPRTTLAQMMDVLSAQATLAGYRAVILAAEALPKLFPLLMTAAGTLAPARVLVLGAGVAGLQAIATARRLGASVEAFDVRRAVREQVESLGARFIGVEGLADAEVKGGYAREASEEEQRQQAALLLAHLGEADVCIATAQVPGRRAPLLLTAGMVQTMRPRSVIVDLAAGQGGNCALTVPGERVVSPGGVTVIGDLDLPAQLPMQASQMWSRNLEKLLAHLTGKSGGALHLDAPDEITRGLLRVRGGRRCP